MQFGACEYDGLFAGAQRFHSFLLAPYDNLLSVPWSLPIAQIHEATGLCCRLFSETDGHTWPLVLAPLVLSYTERETWHRLAGQEGRRRQWLQGRIAAKDAVRLLLKDCYHVEACYADIEVSSDRYGQPRVDGELVAKLGCRFPLSISHSGKVAAALAVECPGHKGVGIDLEPMTQGHEGLEEAGFTVGERSLLDAFEASQREEWLLRLWCAKEAVAKALGRGMMGNPLNLVVLDLDLKTGTVTIGTAGELARQLGYHMDRSVAAYTGRDDSFVFATSFV